MIMHHIRAKWNRCFSHGSLYQHRTSCYKVRNQQILGEALATHELMMSSHLCNAVRSLITVAVDDVHIRTNQQGAASRNGLFQHLQLFRQPHIVLIAVGKAIALRLLRQPLKGAVGTQVFLVAPDLIGKRTDTVLHAGLYLLKRHRGRAVIPNIEF